MKFVIAIKDLYLNDNERKFIENFDPWGIILFSRNIESKNQLKNLTSSIKAIKPNIKILIDEEGGLVSRLKNIITKKDKYDASKTSKYFGDLYKLNPERSITELCETYNFKTKILLELGIDINCAPVCDIGGGYLSNHDRSFSSDVEIVKTLTKYAITSIIETGGIATLKHIPGHGLTIDDSHIDLPVVSLSKEDLLKQESCIFQYLSQEFEKEILEEKIIAMTAHIVYKCLDYTKPATLSKKVVNYIRNEIGFKGLLITDGIEMRALHQTSTKSSKNTFFEDIEGKKNYYAVEKEDLANIAIESFNSGCNIILYCEANIDNAIYIANKAKELFSPS